MKGKRLKSGEIEKTLDNFLKDERHLVLGFKNVENRARHHIFKDNINGNLLLNPVFGANAALYLRRLFSKGLKVVLLLRPCEIRAYVELQKLTQIEREDIIAVSVDCLGAVSSKENIEEIPLEVHKINEYFKNNSSMRWACTVCSEKRGVVGDAGIRIDESGNFWIVPYTEKGEELSTLVEGETEDIPAKMLIDQNPAMDKLKVDMEIFKKDLEKCIMCMNCRDMCPACYCIDCVFNGDEYLPKGDALFNKVFRVGTTEMPQGKELFHLIRMYHVSQTCVGCGACEEACPQGIPLTKYFKGVSERLQGLFSYMSGRSFEEPIPYLTFIEDELKDATD